MACQINKTIEAMNEIANRYDGISIDKKITPTNSYGKIIGKMINVGESYKEDIENIKTVPVSGSTKIDKKMEEFNKLPGYKKGQKNMTYAGIGSRETPQNILNEMTNVSKELNSGGYKLQTGATFKGKEEGADKAFSDGTDNKILFTPEKHGINKKSVAIVNELHPNPKALKPGGLKLMARNTNQIFGENLDTPVDFVLFYAEETSNPLRPKGGTGQAVEMARRKGIPTINMADSDWRNQLDEVLVEEETVEVDTGDKVEISSYQENLEFGLTNPTHTTPRGFARGKTGHKINGKFVKWTNSQKHWLNYLVRKDKKGKPILNKEGKQQNILYKGKYYLDVEEAYQKNKTGKDSDLNLIIELIKTKLETFPLLIEGIELKGGLDYLNKVTHSPTGDTNSRFETSGGNWFQIALIEAYKQADKTKVKVDPFRKLLFDNRQLQKKHKKENISIKNANGGKVTIIKEALTQTQMNAAIIKMEADIKNPKIDKQSNKNNINKQVAIAYGPIDYTYSTGSGKAKHKSKRTPKWLQDLAHTTEIELDKPAGYYNHVLFNKFADKEGIGRHPDNEPVYKDEYDSIGSVVVYSIGDTRSDHIIWGTEYKDVPKNKEDGRFNAESGSLLELSTGNLYHEVPKANGTRYSITFRHIPKNQLTPKPKTPVKPVVKEKMNIHDTEVYNYLLPTNVDKIVRPTRGPWIVVKDGIWSMRLSKAQMKAMDDLKANETSYGNLTYSENENFGNPFLVNAEKSNGQASVDYYNWIKYNKIPDGYVRDDLKNKRNWIINNLDKVYASDKVYYNGTAKDNRISHVTALIQLSNEKFEKTNNKNKNFTVVDLFTRKSAIKDNKNIYLYGENLQHSSGNEIIKKAIYILNEFIGKKYPTISGAVVRGLKNSIPLYTKKSYSPNIEYKISEFDEFKNKNIPQLNKINDAIKSGSGIIVGKNYPGSVKSKYNKLPEEMSLWLKDKLDSINDGTYVNLKVEKTTKNQTTKTTQNNNKDFDEGLNTKLQKILKKLFPNIKLEYTNQSIPFGNGLNQVMKNTYDNLKKLISPEELKKSLRDSVVLTKVGNRSTEFIVKNAKFKPGSMGPTGYVTSGATISIGGVEIGYNPIDNTKSNKIGERTIKNSFDDFTKEELDSLPQTFKNEGAKKKQLLENVKYRVKNNKWRNEVKRDTIVPDNIQKIAEKLLKVKFPNNLDLAKDINAIPYIANLSNNYAKTIDESYYNDKNELVEWMAQHNPRAWSKNDGVVYVEGILGQVSFHVFDQQDGTAFKYGDNPFNKKWSGRPSQKLAESIVSEYIDQKNNIQNQVSDEVLDEAMLKEINSFEMYLDSDKICSEGICNNTAYGSTKHLEKLGLNPFPNQTGSSVAVSVKSPVGEWFIGHYISFVAIDDKLYVYDMPQNEYITHTRTGISRVQLTDTYNPRLIPFNLESIADNYNLADKEAAEFMKSVTKTTADYIKGNTTNSDELLGDIYTDALDKGIDINAKSKSWHELREIEKRSPEWKARIAKDKLDAKNKEKIISQAIIDSRNSEVTKSEKDRVDNMIKTKLKEKIKEYIPKSKNKFVLQDLVYDIFGIGKMELPLSSKNYENIDSALEALRKRVNSKDFEDNLHRKLFELKEAKIDIEKDINKEFEIAKKFQDFVRYAKKNTLDEALNKYPIYRQQLPENLKGKSEAQQLLLMSKSAYKKFGQNKMLFQGRFMNASQTKKTENLINFIKLNGSNALVDYVVNESKRQKSFFEKKGDLRFQKNNGEIKGQADIKAETVLINTLLQTQDTLPHEYAHHYIAMFRDTDIVQEAINKFGSEEKLVQAIGEQVVDRKGEAYTWFEKFTNWLRSKFSSLNKEDKEYLKNTITNSFLTNKNLEDKKVENGTIKLNKESIDALEIMNQLKEEC